MNDNIRKISIGDIKPDMVLASDVVTESGTVLLAKNSMLNNMNSSKLLASEIEHVFVNCNSIEPNSEVMNEQDRMRTSLDQQRIPVVERPDYIEFEKAVNEKTADVKKCIHEISDGGTVNLQQMFQITDDIMSKLRCKSDVLTFISFIKDSDEHTFNHSVNVSLLCNLFGRWLGMSGEELIDLTTAGLLHDIGKTRIPNEILNKKGRLTDTEFAVMKKHPTLGYRILQHQNIPEMIKLGALMHHEKVDGSGYPMGANGEQFGKIPKIITICDIYEAMTANRVYRDKICPFEVIKTFETKVYGELATEFLLVFLRNIAYTYVGNWVKLSNGQEAEVVFINGASLSQPIVRTLDENFIDLSSESNLLIESLV